VGNLYDLGGLDNWHVIVGNNCIWLVSFLLFFKIIVGFLSMIATAVFWAYFDFLTVNLINVDNNK